MVSDKVRTGRAWAGWVMFGGALLMVIGALNIAEGTAALVNDKWVIVARGQLVAVDLTGWGWALILLGIVLALTGIGLLLGQTWARITAIIVLSLHATAHALWLGAHPLWSLLMIGLDVVVICALTAKWPAAQAQLDPSAEVQDVPAPAGISPTASTPTPGTGQSTTTRRATHSPAHQ